MLLYECRVHEDKDRRRREARFVRVIDLESTPTVTLAVHKQHFHHTDVCARAQKHPECTASAD